MTIEMSTHQYARWGYFVINDENIRDMIIKTSSVQNINIINTSLTGVENSNKTSFGHISFYTRKIQVWAAMCLGLL